MELAKLYVALAADAAEYVKDLGEVGKESTSWARDMGRRMGAALKKAITAALITVGVALAAFTTASLADFARFEQGMNEVFTLLPGISEQAMGEMREDVKDLARDMGVLPDEVVPALYQALSAGVPPDNVFDFLEIATKASIGGITELDTAVDGITSVVNAYGDDVIGAAEASDLMFTAVRLGKTDFDQLSRSLFNVIPTASSLGVEFGDVTAGLAALTAQGVPTSVATTQMRQLFVELSREGGKAAKTFEDMAGQSFKEFIASGGNTAEALEIMLAAAEDMDVGVNDLFSSVEAGSAALALAGSETFVENIEEMANAAGATDEAYQTMDQGIGRTIDRLRAFGATVRLDVGEALAPAIGMVLDLAEGALPILSAFLVETVIPAITDGVTAVTGFVTSVADGSVELTGFAATVWALIEPVVETIAGFVEWQDVLLALGAAIAIVVIPIIWGILSPILAVIAIVAVIVGAVAFFRRAWQEDWGGVATFLRNVWQNVILPAFAALRDWVAGTLIPTVQMWYQRWTGEWWPAISAALTVAWGIISGIWATLRDWITGTLIPTVVRLYQQWRQRWQEIRQATQNVWTAVRAIWRELGRWINDNIMPWVEVLAEWWSEKWTEIQTKLETVWAIIEPVFIVLRTWMRQRIVEALNNLRARWVAVMGALEGPINTVKDAWQRLVDAVEGFWNWISGKSFNFDIKLPDLPSWALPGSPLPLHSAWKDFAEDMGRMKIEPQMALPDPLERAALALGGATGGDLGGGAADNRTYQTTIHTSQPPMQIARASRHLDKLGAAGL